MARIVGVDLPPQKQAWVGLTYIHGIGHARAYKALEEAKVEPTKLIKDLTEEEALRIRDAIQERYRVEGELRKEVTQNIKRLMEIGSYRGVRHSRGLPVRGQRTSTNARTRKGPRRMAIAGKRRVTK